MSEREVEAVLASALRLDNFSLSSYGDGSPWEQRSEGDRIIDLMDVTANFIKRRHHSPGASGFNGVVTPTEVERLASALEVLDYIAKVPSWHTGSQEELTV